MTDILWMRLTAVALVLVVVWMFSRAIAARRSPEESEGRVVEDEHHATDSDEYQKIINYYLPKD